MGVPATGEDSEWAALVTELVAGWTEERRLRALERKCIRDLKQGGVIR